jgi:shikimate dehydrogenase
MKALYGLLGKKLGHSLSPEIHSIIFGKLGLSGCYHLFEVENKFLKSKLMELNALGTKGVNVTIPYKREIIPYLDSLSPQASSIGAVNTIKFSGGKTTGHNTDYTGLMMTFNKNKVHTAKGKVVVLGSGGVALTLIQFLIDNGVGDLTIVGRDITKLKNTPAFKQHRLATYGDLNCIRDCDILINCTPCGMYPNVNESPVEKAFVSRFRTVLDLIYNPTKTVLLSYAEECGLQHINGMYMLVCQAVAAQEIWNDIKVPENLIDEINEVMESMIRNRM